MADFLPLCVISNDYCLSPLIIINYLVRGWHEQLFQEVHPIMKHFSCSLEMIGNLVEHSDGYFFIQDGLSDAFLQFVHVFLQSFSVASFVFEMGPREFEVIPGKFHETWPIVPAGFAKAVKPVRTLQPWGETNKRTDEYRYTVVKNTTKYIVIRNIKNYRLQWT